LTYRYPIGYLSALRPYAPETPMQKRPISRRAALLSLALTLALPLGLASAARADDAATPGKAEKTLGVVKIDIDEQLDGKPFRDTAVTVRLRKKLRELGFKAWSERSLFVDEYEKKKREKAEKAKAPTGTAAPVAPAPAPEDEKPDHDLVLKGKVVIRLDRSSTFFGGNVAFMYTGTVELTITDKAGKTLATISEKDEWGKTDEKKARDDEIRRTAAFAALAVMKAEPVYGRLGPKAKAAVDEYAGEVAKNYPRTPPEGEKPIDATPAAGENGEKKQ